MTLYSKAGLGSILRFKPNLWDMAVLILIFSLFIILSQGWKEVIGNLTSLDEVQVSLDPAMLPDYALRSSLRMFIALACSLLFTFIYGSIAAKTVIGNRFFIPILDILQSVPILGFLSFIIVVFMKIFPGKILGMECAAIFAIFTSQAWNMTFSFYQSLRTIPPELKEAAMSFQLTGWQRFWQLEVPFALPHLLWNGIMSMSAGWFFVVASEAISIGNTTVKLPGIGSYLALAIDHKDLPAIAWAMITMLIVIVGYDQLLFRPLTVWAHKFKVEQASDQSPPKSWFLSMIHSTRLIKRLFYPLKKLLNTLIHLPLKLPQPMHPIVTTLKGNILSKILGWMSLMILLSYASFEILNFIFFVISPWELLDVTFLGLITMVRVGVLLIICTVVWVPIGVWIGLHPRLTQILQPLIQYLSAFPANLLFPLVIIPIVHFHLNPNIWLSVLMIIGSQWYILLNVIAGANAIPHELRELIDNLHIDGWLKWKKLLLPSIYPYFITGAITASGAAWNTSIIAEVATWGDTKLTATGIGAYITNATTAGDYPRIITSIAVMSILIVLINRFIWHPLSARASKRFSLD